MTRPILSWCLAPVIIALFHLAFGGRMRLAETASEQRRAAAETERAGRYEAARSLYLAARKTAHPSDLRLRTRLDIDIARTSILSGNPLEGVDQMDRLLATLENLRLRLPLEEEAKATRALGLYFAAYALRLDSPVPEVWREEAEAARRLFRELHDTAKAQNRTGDTLFYGRNLEASILLQRLRQAELASAPTPSPVLAALETGITAKKLKLQSAP